MWQEVRRLVGIRDVPTVIVDYERAAFNAVNSVFGQHEVGGCFFHFKAAMWRRLQELGLERRYCEDEGFRGRFCTLGGLAFVPPQYVVAAFEQMRPEFPHEEQAFLAYFEATWIVERRVRIRKNPMFPLDMWSVHARFLHHQALITNACENWHRVWRHEVHHGCTHPGMEEFLKGLTRAHTVCLNHAGSVAAAGMPRELPRETAQRLHKVQQCVHDFYASGEALRLAREAGKTWKHIG